MIALFRPVAQRRAPMSHASPVPISGKGWLYALDGMSSCYFHTSSAMTTSYSHRGEIRFKMCIFALSIVAR
jgi:hypothetical protein